MQGFDKLGNALSSLVSSPIQVSRNKAIAEYYETMRTKQLQADTEAAEQKQLEDTQLQAMQENFQTDMKHMNESLSNDNSHSKAYMNIQASQNTDKAALARKMANISRLQATIEQMQAKDDLNSHKKLMEDSDIAMNVQFEDNVPTKGGKH